MDLKLTLNRPKLCLKLRVDENWNKKGSEMNQYVLNWPKNGSEKGLNCHLKVFWSFFKVLRIAHVKFSRISLKLCNFFNPKVAKKISWCI